MRLCVPQYMAERVEIEQAERAAAACAIRRSG